MNKEDIIAMAREAQMPFYWRTGEITYLDKLERFAALVASAERESLRESFRVVTAAEASAAILHEREACAKVCEDLYSNLLDDKDIQKHWPERIRTNKIYATAIRARGQA